MRKIKIISTAILISIPVCILTAGCGDKVVIPEIQSTVSHDQNEGTTDESKETKSEEDTESGEATKALPETPAPPEDKTDAPESTTAAGETESGNSDKPQPTPSTPDGNGVKLLEVEGFVGSNQESYNPYGCDREKAEETAKRLESGKLSTQGLFKNTLFVGDSITVGFSDYKIANEGNVIAHVGARLEEHLAENMQKIIDYNPEVLFIHYGLNEMDNADHFIESFINEMRTQLTVLKEELPYTKIVVMAVWPIKDSAVQAQPRLASAPKYNQQMRELCVELGVAYEERSELIASRPDLYAGDGIHCAKQMYINWINDFVKEMGLY